MLPICVSLKFATTQLASSRASASSGRPGATFSPTCTLLRPTTPSCGAAIVRVGERQLGLAQRRLRLAQRRLVAEHRALREHALLERAHARLGGVARGDGVLDQLLAGGAALASGLRRACASRLARSSSMPAARRSASAASASARAAARRLRASSRLARARARLTSKSVGSRRTSTSPSCTGWFSSTGTSITVPPTRAEISARLASMKASSVRSRWRSSWYQCAPKPTAPRAAGRPAHRRRPGARVRSDVLALSHGAPRSRAHAVEEDRDEGLGHLPGPAG